MTDVSKRPEFAGRRARVCFLIEHFHPASNGAITQATLLGQRLIRSGSQVSVITQLLNKSHLGHERIDGIDTYRVGVPGGPARLGKYLMLLPALYTLVRIRRQYDAIVVFDLKALGVIGVVAAKLLAKKCFLRAESCGEVDGRIALESIDSPWRSRVADLIVRFRNRLLFRADGLISISSPLWEEFVRAGAPTHRMVSITNGIDVERFCPVDVSTKRALRQTLGMPSDEIIFMYSGRLARKKGLEMLLRVWRRIQDNDAASAHLVLVGSGQECTMSCEDDLREFVSRQHLSASVTFAGRVECVQDYLKAADCFVFPSETEALGLSLVEAMACGVPAIATRVGGIPTFVEEGVTGVLVPPNDEDRLYEAMTAFVDDQTQALAMTGPARLTVESRFDVDRIVTQYLNLLAEAPAAGGENVSRT
jgi:glycosyltransferase involved in cell wall biosynthesis